jgi:hypothetical protein
MISLGTKFQKSVCFLTPTVRRACCPQGHDAARNADDTQHTVHNPLQFLMFENFLLQKGSPFRDPET